MRQSKLAAAVFVVVSALAPAALAQPRVAPPQPVAPINSSGPDRSAAIAVAAALTALDARVYADELRMTQLRDTELAQSNAIMRAIRPALAFKGDIVR